MRYPASEKLEIVRLVEHPICRCAGRWRRWAFSLQASIAGTIDADRRS